MKSKFYSFIQKAREGEGILLWRREIPDAMGCFEEIHQVENELIKMIKDESFGYLPGIGEHLEKWEAERIMGKKIEKSQGEKK